MTITLLEKYETQLKLLKICFTVVTNRHAFITIHAKLLKVCFTLVTNRHAFITIHVKLLKVCLTLVTNRPHYNSQ